LELNCGNHWFSPRAMTSAESMLACARRLREAGDVVVGYEGVDEDDVVDPPELLSDEIIVGTTNNRRRTATAAAVHQPFLDDLLAVFAG